MAVTATLLNTQRKEIIKEVMKTFNDSMTAVVITIHFWHLTDALIQTDLQKCFHANKHYHTTVPE